jgi:antitoxin component of MazEF toxin-antitoxin module
MTYTFKTILTKAEDVNATGIRIPEEGIKALNSGKKPKVVVTVNSFTYRTTVAVMGDAFMIPLSQERRAEAKVQPGDEIEVTLELDTEPRTVEIPADLAAALAQKPGATEAFDKLAFSIRKEHVRQVESARAAETRTRRIASIVEKVGN